MGWHTDKCLHLEAVIEKMKTRIRSFGYSPSKSCRAPQAGQASESCLAEKTAVEKLHSCLIPGQVGYPNDNLLG